MNKKKLFALLNLILIIVVFLALSYFVQTNLPFFERLIVNDFLGMLVYFLLHIIAIVIAPITVFPLIPVATALWGQVQTFFITLVAWEVGAIIAFIVARKYGAPLVKRLIPLREIYKIEEKVSKYGNGFWEILFLRIIIPADGLSYAIGLFSKVRFIPYSIATLIGVMPFLFLFTYFGTVDFIYQLIIVLSVLIAFMVWLVIKGTRN